jgi:ATP-dependent RNA helicase DeaD
MVQELAGDEEGVALLAMLLDDYYQQSLHAPPVTVEEVTPRRDSRRVDRTVNSGKNRRRSGGRSRRN